MFKHLEMNERVSCALAALIFSALALVFCLDVAVAPKYADFVVGSVTWSAQTKFQDLVAVPAFLVAFVCAFLFLASTIERQKRLFGTDSALELSSQYLWWSLPAIAAVASFVFFEQKDSRIFYGSISGITFIALAATASALRGIDVNPRIYSVGALGILLLALVKPELALVLGRAPAAVASDIDLTRLSRLGYVIAALGWVAGLIYAIWSPKGFSRNVSKLLLIVQLGLSTFYLVLYPARLQEPNGSVSKYDTSVWLKVLLVGMIAWAIIDVIKRFKKYSLSQDLSALFSPVAFFGLLLALKAGNTIFPVVSPDDYHFGESMLGWWSYLHGVVPYIGYIPAHGIIGDDFTQFLSFAFYDGSAGTIAQVGNLAFAVLAFASFLSLYYFTRSIGFAFISIFCLFGNLSWLYLTPFLCLWLSPRLYIRPTHWLMVWMVTAPIAVLGVPPQGLLLAAASGLMAAYFAWRVWQNRKTEPLTGVIAMAVVILVVGLVTPIGSMLLGAIRYVLENGPINQVAYGIPWSLSWVAGGQRGFVFEVVRMSWIAIPLVCLLLIYGWCKDANRRAVAVFPLVIVLFFVLLLIPYSMGRIDPGAMSRPGLAASLGWAILLPVAVWRVFDSGTRVMMIVIVASISSVLGFAPFTTAINNLIQSTAATIATPVLRDGPSAGLPNLGRASVQEEHWVRLTSLSKVLAEHVPAGETYLDLTSRNAQYFYLGYRPLLPVTAAYNMVSPAQQQRAIDTLKGSLPTVALLEGVNVIHDGGGLALRNPYLYRFIVDHYDPAYVNGFILGYKKGSVEAQSLQIDIPLMDFTDVHWLRGVHRNAAAAYVEDPALVSLIKVGDEVRTHSGDVRRVVRVDVAGQSVWLEGPPLEVSSTGSKSSVTLLKTDARELAEYKTALLQTAFGQAELQKIPVAWGRSQASLDKKMTRVKSLDDLNPSLNQLAVQEEAYRVEGADPSMSFDLSALKISGHDAGLLKFEFRCSGRAAEPRIQVFWWGDGQQGPFEASSVRFNAEDGTLIVPLDASPRWLMLQHVKGIRIDLDNAGACSSFKVDNLGLYQRQH
ncbi:hypothetical protein [Pseudomonas gessardii]|uniref:hypothetical protein n=1 Tax=Pseudomonas gessardii TaxID=78544 RepID=UPI0018D9731A|nr:hypothetical protein [Pseudomonas gessardii]MBH3425499.1 hypothetical protein [Pseudomonas gessardii]